MFDPLPDSVIATLRSNETAALAAMLIIGGSFPDILAFATRVLAPPTAVAEPPKRARGRQRRNNRREACDERLVAAMKANPGASIGELADAIGKSRTTTVSALHRLRDAGLAESLSGISTLTEPPPPKETPRWTAPVSEQRRRARVEEREHALKVTALGGPGQVLRPHQGQKAVPEPLTPTL